MKVEQAACREVLTGIMYHSLSRRIMRIKKYASDGICNNIEVGINGEYLGKRPNGYILFQYDLTPFLNYGKENHNAIQVDHSKFGDSRWYQIDITGYGRNFH